MKKTSFKYTYSKFKDKFLYIFDKMGDKMSTIKESSENESDQENETTNEQKDSDSSSPDDEEPRNQASASVNQTISEFDAKTFSDDVVEIKEIQNENSVELRSNKKQIQYHGNNSNRKKILNVTNDTTKEEFEFDKKLEIGTLIDIEQKQSSESSPNINRSKLILRQVGPSGKPSNRSMSKSISNRVKSLIDSSKEKTVRRTKIEIEKSKLTLNETFKGNKYIADPTLFD